MGAYNLIGEEVSTAYNLHGEEVSTAYNLHGEDVGLSGTVKNPSYAFSGMAMTDTDGITTFSDSHLRNAEQSVLITTPDTSAHTVSFTCDIPTKNKRIGLFVWSNRKNIDDGITLSISVNGVSKTPYVKEGFDYYWFDGITDNITSIDVTVTSKVSGAEIYLDSVEVGYHMTEKAIIMLNFDASPNMLLNTHKSSMGDLLDKYGFKATMQYVLTSDAVEGSSAVGFDSEIHKELIEKGHDYCSYSGWQEKGYGNNIPIPSYTDESKYNEHKTHAEMLWKMNNDNGVYAPSGIHSTGFKAGEVYERALVDVGFPMIRVGNRQDHSACFAHFDSVDYRAIVPYFIYDIYDISGVQALKDTVYYACNNKLCLQIGTHAIESPDATELGSSLNVSYQAFDSLLSYIKTKVDEGVCEVITTQEFIRRYAPEFYATWYEERKKSFVY